MKIRARDPLAEELHALRLAGRLAVALPTLGALLGAGRALQALALRIDPLVGPVGLEGPVGPALAGALIGALGLRTLLTLREERRTLAAFAALATAAVAHSVAVDGGHPLQLALPALLWGLWARLEQLGRRAASAPAQQRPARRPAREAGPESCAA